MGTRLYRSTYVCELENVRTSEKGKKECVAYLPFHGMGVSLHAGYALGMGVGESYLTSSLIYIYISNESSRKKNTTHSNHYAIELFIVHKIRKDLENWITLDFMLASKLRII